MNNKDITPQEAARQYPGAAIDIADDEKVTPCLVDQETHLQNNNPRTSDQPGPPQHPLPKA